MILGNFVEAISAALGKIPRSFLSDTRDTQDNEEEKIYSSGRVR